MKKILVKMLTPFNIMVRECAWCKKRPVIGFMRGGTGITSGMCEKCAEHYDEAVRERKAARGRILDAFQAVYPPVRNNAEVVFVAVRRR